MARGKKKETLTPEERLQAALVPDWEQPYKVPENWCWVKVGDLCTFIGGGTPDKTKPLYWNGNISWASVKDIKGSCLYSTIDKISQLGLECSSSNLCDVGDLLLVTRIEPAKAIVSKIVTAINQDLKIVKSELSSLFLYYYFCAFQHEFEKKASGSTVKGITLPNIQNTPFPLPPLPEQQRIVDRIESLFAKLDEAKQKAQDALDSFETRKAAILHKAFTGELTAQWRNEHGLVMESWENIALMDVCILRSGTTIPVDRELSNGNIPYVKVADMNLPENYLTITTSSRFVNSCVESQIIPYGSTIFPKRGGAILTNKKRFIAVPKIIADLNIMAIIPNNELMNNWYCYYWMLSIDLRELNNGSNVPQINNKDMVKLYIPKPSLSEQTEIVHILDDLLAKEQQAKETAEAVLEQIDLIKKSILARAFRGELGTNDPTEESAVELVRNII